LGYSGGFYIKINYVVEFWLWLFDKKGRVLNFLMLNVEFRQEKGL